MKPFWLKVAVTSCPERRVEVPSLFLELDNDVFSVATLVVRVTSIAVSGEYIEANALAEC